MIGINSLRDIYSKEGLLFIKKLFEESVTIGEKINGTRFCFERSAEDLVFYKKDGKITLIDRAISSLYEVPIKYIENLNFEIISKIPVNYRFGFRYIHSLKDLSINYDRLPLNRLILTDVKDDQGKIISDVNLLNQYGDILQVEKPPIIWQGKLDDAQKTKLLEYLRTTDEKLNQRFKSESFTKYIISILNPEIKRTALNDDVEKAIDSIIFKFESDDTYFYSKVIDPMVLNVNKSNEKERESQDIYGIILSDIIEFFKYVNLEKYVLTGKSEEEKYVELVCYMFNDYILNKSSMYDGLNLEASVPQLEINEDYINDLLTSSLIEKNTTNKQILRIFISTFNKPKRKTSGTISQVLLNNIEDLAKTIKNKIKEKNIRESDIFITFDEYINKNKN